ncbi:exodeoxyribonuclease III [Ahniella affigens]|uniref:Exodeoxyribonuclease III n=1 Tax=Ahniella affigens TaxID=2021234 RepID=A0A2P1PYD8_9GAMM|nr:exodeoxyribonuclease III [Ahniella affigens]AVP99843.1 exodeoxyribonuclease III [Ahniella affigens]
MKIASWNVNSLKARMEHVQAWLESAKPDVLAMQEIKMESHLFPEQAFQALGYHCLANGQKTYNGVAIIAKTPMQDVITQIPNFADEQRRVLAATIGDLRVIDLYVVNGQEVGSEKYQYKLNWLEALQRWLEDEAARYPNLVVLGDFNIAPDDRDVHDPEAWHESVLCSTAERNAYKRLLDLGLLDSYRELDDNGGVFSWWDYRQAAFRRNLGLRIDLVLISQALRGQLKAAGIDREPRKWDKPSDHAPVWVEL